MRKRLLSGMREVAKAVKLRKAHSVVVVPNVEAISSQGKEAAAHQHLGL